ncbi:MAG TPA: electron transfer flavoprotein subunit alpha/FixB family protein [Nitrososphaeraceae archaeon]|jgi:electron transfer flavoprotein alpha subunit|nr:electron transfer flavoprotein subunit alpha/FixB family protein [Nitrososphaeraceae archaeon]
MSKLLGRENISNTNEKYRHIYVIIEHFEGQVVPVSLEMLGEARRLMDDFNQKYNSSEKVVAVLLGSKVRKLCDELVTYGADSVIYANHEELRYPRNDIDTRVIVQIAKDVEILKEISPEYENTFVKPRYMFFAADNIGRHLSSTVLAELESGLASDINKLVISDLDIRHEHKTKGQSVKYEKTLEMYRPDFSGFLWTTILCLDNKNPENLREYHPQGCSIIPGAFKPIESDNLRKGTIVEYYPKIDQDLKIKILSRRVIEKKIDYETCKIVVSFGRGIKDNPEQNIKLVEEFAELLDAEIGITLPLSKKPYQLSQNLDSKYMIPDRVIGTSGSKVTPTLYVAVGLSGAIQHVAGMKDSEMVLSINTDENSPIVDESDIFIKGRMEQVIPILIDQIKKQMPSISIRGQ